MSFVIIHKKVDAFDATAEKIVLARAEPYNVWNFQLIICEKDYFSSVGYI